MQYCTKSSSDNIDFQELYHHLYMPAFETGKQVSVNKQPDVYFTLQATWQLWLMVPVLDVSFSHVISREIIERMRAVLYFSDTPN